MCCCLNSNSGNLDVQLQCLDIDLKRRGKFARGGKKNFAEYPETYSKGGLGLEAK